MMTNSIRRRLRALQQNGDLVSLETCCRELLIKEEDPLTRGCLLWNLSDVYAMRREADMLLANHRLFEAHVQPMSSMYRLWLVCDATQRLTLEYGGFDGFWWNMYRDATATYSPACEAALFEAHRAAFYKSPRMPYDRNRAGWVKDRLEAFLKSADHSPSAVFYRLMFTALCLKHFGEEAREVVACCEAFLADLRCPAEEPLCAAGEWEAVNRHRARCVQARIGINTAVNTLIDSGNVNRARELYKTAREYGLPVNTYIEQRL